mmetsp:Transcript_10113/g.24170  ORF Transcript_10113/g.24170 Transcript_10113/m.24170 type:complete len:200 (+) Transcript_10113:824-1423(+)
MYSSTATGPFSGSQLNFSRSAAVKFIKMPLPDEPQLGLKTMRSPSRSIASTAHASSVRLKQVKPRGTRIGSGSFDSGCSRWPVRGEFPFNMASGRGWSTSFCSRPSCTSPNTWIPASSHNSRSFFGLRKGTRMSSGRSSVLDTRASPASAAAAANDAVAETSGMVRSAATTSSYNFSRCCVGYGSALKSKGTHTACHNW